MKIEKIYNKSLIIGTSFSVICAVFAPRFLAYLPIILGILGFLTHRPVLGAWPDISKNTAIFLLSVTLLSGMSFFWAINPQAVSERTFKLSILFFGGALLLALPNQQNAAFFRKIYPYIMIIALALCAFELWSSGFLYKLINPWPDPTKMLLGDLNMSNYNRCVVFLLIAVWPAFAILRAKGTKENLTLSVLLIILTLSVVIKTQSQSAQLAFLAASLFFLIFPTHCRYSWYGLLAVILAVFWSLPWVMPLLFAHLPDYLRGVSWFEQGYAIHRLEIWDFISRYIQQNPFYGHGIEATRYIPDFDTQKLYYRGQSVLHPHNFMLQIWIEFGALGVALFSGWFTWAVLQLKDMASTHTKAYGAVFIAVLAISSTAYGLWQGWWIGSLFLFGLFLVFATHQENSPKAL